MGERHIEMLWTCAACSSRNLGRHLSCPRCGKAKTTEAYEMPDDVSKAASVTDSELLRQAEAGANWVCRYCGSDQRRLDGECARCGGEASQRERPDSPPAGPAARSVGASMGNHAAAPASRSRPLALIVALVAVPLLLVAACGALATLNARRRVDPVSVSPPVAETPPSERPGPRQGEVKEVRWERKVIVERYQLVPAEGFAEQRPPTATEVKPAGQRVHHVDQVPDGFREETYTEEVPDGFREETYSEVVPDGTRSESYSERVACGQDCKSTPKTCRQECKSQKNGFAKCTDVCTGGGQTCSTRYCDERRTRQVPVTKTVTRTRKVPKTKTVTKTRQVPKTRPVERMAEWFTWKDWGWKEDRVEKREGAAPPFAWPPEASLDAGTKLGKGEQERARKVESYQVVAVDAFGKEHRYVPRDGESIETLKPGDPVTIVVGPSGSCEAITAAAPRPAASGP